MTTAGEGSTPTALDLLFGPDTDAAKTLADDDRAAATATQPIADSLLKG